MRTGVWYQPKEFGIYLSHGPNLDLNTDILCYARQARSRTSKRNIYLIFNISSETWSYA